MKFFSYESPFSQTLLKLAYSAYLNLLWFVCSLPVFTVGAATTALYSVTLKIVREREGNLTQQFFRAFRENFRQATVLWLILLCAGLFLAGDGYILYHLFQVSRGPAAVFWTLVSALVIAASIAYAVVLLYVFPLTASVVNTNRAMLRNSFFIGTHYLFCTILTAGIHFAMFYVTVALFTPALIFGEGLCALMSSYLLSGVIRACSFDPAQSGDDGESADGGESDRESGYNEESGYDKESGNGGEST
ncbi:MAG: YesL family protein [Oscillibacter sp.]|nr:YesL family protein [Oscillibacter sp.]